MQVDLFTSFKLKRNVSVRSKRCQEAAEGGPLAVGEDGGGQALQSGLLPARGSLQSVLG